MTLTKVHLKIVIWPGETVILQRTMTKDEPASVAAASEEVTVVEVVDQEATVHGAETAKEDEVMGSAGADVALKTMMRKKMAKMILTTKTEITEAIVAVADKEAPEAVPEVAQIIEEDAVNTVNHEVEVAEATSTITTSQSTNRLKNKNSTKAANSIKMSSISLMRKCEIMRIN